MDALFVKIIPSTIWYIWHLKVFLCLSLTVVLVPVVTPINNLEKGHKSFCLCLFCNKWSLTFFWSSQLQLHIVRTKLYSWFREQTIYIYIISFKQYKYTQNIHSLESVFSQGSVTAHKRLIQTCFSSFKYHKTVGLPYSRGS